MSLHDFRFHFVLLLLIPFSSLAADKNPGVNISPSLGKVTMNYVGSIVSPDGSGLPVGSGSVSDGKAIYENKCVACHGLTGEQPGNQLAGGLDSLPTMRPLKTVGSFWPYATTVYDYVARAMPYNEAKSLSPDEVYAVTAYVLYLSGIVGESVVLDQQSLVEVEMPNKDGFIELVR
jgi:S-disulfanyl-L-cysteine oxidoreductase SoxD